METTSETRAWSTRRVRELRTRDYVDVSGARCSPSSADRASRRTKDTLVG
jgi:hypothetical protein